MLRGEESPNKRGFIAMKTVSTEKKTSCTWILPLLWLLLCVAAMSGCNPRFAPPVRTSHYGAPGKLKSGQIEVGGAGNIFGTGGPELSYSLRDWLQIELGSDLSFLEKNPKWAMGWGGVRLTHTQNSTIHANERMAWDIELGGGAGAGGENHCSSQETDCSFDSRAWSDRLAWGGYAGLGVGFHKSWYSLFLRARAQFTSASDIPATFWFSGMLGIGSQIANHFNWYLAGGGAGYTNSKDSEGGVLGEIGMSVQF